MAVAKSAKKNRLGTTSKSGGSKSGQKLRAGAVCSNGPKVATNGDTKVILGIPTEKKELKSFSLTIKESEIMNRISSIEASIVLFTSK